MMTGSSSAVVAMPDADHSGESLLDKSINATLWSYGGVALMVILQIIGSIVFARLLGPQIVGVFSFGLLVFPPFKALCEYGLGSALINKSQLEQGEIGNALANSFILTLLTSLFWLLTIGFIATLANQQQYIQILGCFAVAMLTLPLQSICTAVLSRSFDHKYLQLASVLAYALGYLGVGYLGYLNHWGAWSLVAGFLAQNIITMMMLVFRTRLQLAITFKRTTKSIWQFGSHATLITISNWLTSCLDNMVVAFYFGTTTLGIYSVAYGLVRTPADKIVTTLQNVLFPASAQTRNDKQRLAKMSLAIVDAVFLIAAPAFCAVAVLSKTIIETLYGSEWRQASMVLTPFALSMILHCLTVICSALLWGTGKVHQDMRIQWSTAVLFLITVIVAAHYSFVAVAWTILPVTALRVTVSFKILSDAVKVSSRQLAYSLRGGFIVACATTPLLVLIDHTIKSRAIALPLVLVIDITSGVLLWSIFSLLFSRLLTPELHAGLRALCSSISRQFNHA